MSRSEETGSEEAEFELLVRRQSRFVFRVAYAILRNGHDAEDAAQETFLKLYRNGAWMRIVSGEIRDERAFLARMAWRLAVDRLRRVPVSEEMGEEPVSSGLTPEQELASADAEGAIHRLIDALPEALRQPLALSCVEELNSREIAAILGIPEGTVRTRLMRARQLLREKMTAEREGRYAR